MSVSLQTEELWEKIDKLLQFTPQALTRTEDLGKRSGFLVLAPSFEQLLNLAREIRGLDLRALPLNSLETLDDHLNRVNSTINAIIAFQPDQPDAQEARRSLISQVLNVHHGLFTAAVPIVSYLSRNSASAEEHKRISQEARQSISVTQSEIQKLKDELQHTVEASRKAAAKVGIAEHAAHFLKEARAHDILGQRWLYATCVLFALTVGAGIGQFWVKLPSSASVAESIQLAASKVAVLSALYYAMVWCGRTYKAQQHNYVVNRHRLNALSTFEAFVQAAGDEQTKNAVLLQATNSIFSAQPSGFVTQEVEHGNPQIIEIIRGALDGRK